jgi:hypothetical protein
MLDSIDRLATLRLAPEGKRHHVRVIFSSSVIISPVRPAGCACIAGRARWLSSHLVTAHLFRIMIFLLSLPTILWVSFSPRHQTRWAQAVQTRWARCGLDIMPPLPRGINAGACALPRV